jgi:hypothetical protein
MNRRGRFRSAISIGAVRELLTEALPRALGEIRSGGTRTGCQKGSGVPMRSGDRKPRESTFSQFGAVAGDADAAAPLAKIFTILRGTSEIQRMLIGRAVTGLDVR